MRLKSLTIAGFRGFNHERTIEFDERLSLIAAPNSHGKTSISEALEFLLFGATSKVAHADSKEEYRDSYRNRHYPKTQPAYIEAVFTEASSSNLLKLRVELDSQGNTTRFCDGGPVSDWPFATEMVGSAQPFILQHALKYLLLVPPAERFQGFAGLLGLADVDVTHQAIVNLCTKPTASIPAEGKKALSDLESVEVRLGGFAELDKVAKELKRGFSGGGGAYKVVESRVDKLLGKKTQLADRLAQLVRARDEATAKVYGGTVAIMNHSVGEAKDFESSGNILSSTISQVVIDEYGKLASQGLSERLAREARLLDLGIPMIGEEPDLCPLCGQPLDGPIRTHLIARHEELKTKVGVGSTPEEIRIRTISALKDIRSALEKRHTLLANRCAGLIKATLKENAPKVQDLLGSENVASWQIIQSAKTTLEPFLSDLTESAKSVQALILTCEEGVKSKNEEVQQIGDLAKGLDDYLVTANSLNAKLNDLEPSLVGPARLLQRAVDNLAGTTEMTLLVELLEKRPAFERSLRIRDVLTDLKELKKHADQTLGEVMDSAIDRELTESVMNWYGKIRTTGDPDVHFSGFAMERTKTGDFKSRRVRVKARSYGVELASAVSSLSESKLNALGLCVSIASALRTPGLWDFLVFDDPIQSWDDEHETQFVGIVRELAEQGGKQIILLSHKSRWIDSVSLGCRTLNGLHYEISGYTQDGPHIRLVEWATIDQRLNEADTIANDPTASTVRLQQAEEEIRLAACQLAAEIAKAKLGRDTSPHNMNKNDVRAILNTTGYEAGLVDKVVATFGSSDDAHHTPKSYEPNAQRIRQHVATLRELKKLS